jgi:hypothetical protein
MVLQVGNYNMHSGFLTVGNGLECELMHYLQVSLDCLLKTQKWPEVLTKLALRSSCCYLN